MVGIFGRGNRSPSARLGRSSTDALPTPPPPYIDRGLDHDHAVFATETTTTTHVVTTTTQTTHFFSLPLFRRRTQAELSDHPDPKLPSSDELGNLEPTPFVLLRDKDLPPTPTPSDDIPSIPPQARENSPSITHTDHASPRRPSEGPSTNVAAKSSKTFLISMGPSDIPTHSTIALARATLGLGLTPALVDSGASPSSELNTVSFTTLNNPSTSSLSHPPTPVMRRAKSFYRDPGMSTGSPADARERRRTRGLSLGPLFSFEGKGKEKGHNPAQDQVPSLPRPLVRKPSFWSRMRKDSHSRGLACSASDQPSLPQNPPLEPRLSVQPNCAELLGYGPQQSVVLRRRHSEKGTSPTSSEFSRHGPAKSNAPRSETGPARKRDHRRPRTAGGSDVSDCTQIPAPDFCSPSISRIGGAPLPQHRVRTSTASSPQQPESARPPTQTNPPLFHRLSLNLFGPHSTPPLTGNLPDNILVDSPPSSLSGSARPSLSKAIHRPTPQSSFEIPQPRHSEETPEVYLQRLTEAVSKAEVANVLASSADEFHIRALRAYIGRFDFSVDPLDVALRRLLMDVGLPRETQQIDRVIEAFAAEYARCHPNLFVSADHLYILAFSLIMLHTDAFNKSNRRKMTKSDYIKNTKLPGVPLEVLDCFYDNIVFAPFIFIEDPLDVNGQRGLIPDSASPHRPSALSSQSPGGHSASGSMFLGRQKIDPYYLITNDLLDGLRVQCHTLVPLTSPYFHQGTTSSWDEEELLHAFAMASIVEIRPPDSNHSPSPWFSLSVSGGLNSVSASGSPPFSHGVDIFPLKVTKVGLLIRKDDLLEGGRRAMSRKWKEWSVLLTGSQLLLSRDTTWAATIQARMDPANGELSMPQPLIPKPDELLSVRDAVAVFDSSYTKYRHTLRLVLPDGRHILFRAPDEEEMNSWIACVNYASAFKTAGVRMRSLGMSGKDIELTGQAAAVSHLRDLEYQRRPSVSPRVLTWGERPPVSGDPAHDQDENLRRGRTSRHTPSLGSSRMGTTSVDSSSDDPTTPSIDQSARILKATFDGVKEELAASHSGPTGGMDDRPRAVSLGSSISKASKASKHGDWEALRVSSRSKIIRSKIHDLQSRILLAQNQLDSDIRLVRNIAILTPFQRTTRDRLRIALVAVSRRIMQVRLNLEKLVCHRDVLSRDLSAEERDWQRTKKLALKAAKAKLLSRHDEQPNIPQTPPSLQHTTLLRNEPLHSTVGASPDWPGRPFFNEIENASIYNLDVLRSDVGGDLDHGNSRAFALTSETSFDSSITADDWHPTSGDSHSPEGAVEQAEEWNKTRAAKRVSLVRLPSDLKISALFNKHLSAGGSIAISEDPGAPHTPPALHTSCRSATFSDATPDRLDS